MEKTTLLDTQEELESALANYVQNAIDSIFSIREYKPDIDTEEIFKIYLKANKDQSPGKENACRISQPENEGRY